MLASIPDTGWQDDPMTRTEPQSLLMPSACCEHFNVPLSQPATTMVATARKVDPKELRKLPGVEVVPGLAPAREKAQP